MTTLNSLQQLPDEDLEDFQGESLSSADSKSLKNKKKKEKKKAAKERKRAERLAQAVQSLEAVSASHQHDPDDVRKAHSNEHDTQPIEGVLVEYVPEGPAPEMNDIIYKSFLKVFRHFQIEEAQAKGDAKTEEEGKVLSATKDETEVDVFAEKKEEGGDEETKPLSRKKWKRLNRPTVWQLKQMCSRPDLVEMHDPCSNDPFLLVYLKSYRNSVQVPRHWISKRKYLQGKRGIEKPPFELPAFIRATGIMEMREAVQEKDDKKNMKSKMRERARPKLGKIDIDYQKLHDAFFRYQTKPPLTSHGDLYYEGKETELRLKEKRPGELTDDLRIALGMPISESKHKYPPPWLVAMQRYGPPPSYPTLKIAGLNAPIPEGCSFGYHAGGWGKPPVDEFGRPLYGDVFGTGLGSSGSGGGATGGNYSDIIRTHWGELESESESEEELEPGAAGEMEMEEEEEGLKKKADITGLVTPAEGLVTPGGVASISTVAGASSVAATALGLETPESIELRKRRIEAEMEGGESMPPPLYTVLPEKGAAAAAAPAAGLGLAPAHLYDVSAAMKQAAALAPGAAAAGAGAAPGAAGAKGKEKGVVELSLQPEELELEPAHIEARYEETVRAQQEDERGDRTRKRKKPTEPDAGKAQRKHKEFKF